MRISVLAVGRLRPPFSDDVEHYRKLIARHARLELIELREDDQVARRLARAPRGGASGPEAYTVLLDRGGRTFDSEELARWLEERRQSGRDLCLIVGGPYGLSLEQVDERLSLGPLTLPHQLARVVLLEQLYRAHKILAGEPYHY